MTGAPHQALPQLVGFTAEEYAFAKAWELHAPGYTGWTVLCDPDDGMRSMTVYPPLAYDEGFLLEREPDGVTLSCLGKRRSLGNLRAALLLICPLPEASLAEVVRLSQLPETAIL